MSAEKNYYSALERLERDEPQVLPKGTLINNDTVALEGGRKRGSIKKQRYPELCTAIDDAAKRQQDKVLAVNVSNVHDGKRSAAGDKLLKDQYKSLKHDYRIALQQNISLVYEVFTLKKKIAALEQGGNVVNFSSL
ncbi:hypothetical protein [Pseudomonas sp. NBRC 111128]|uniref:hypothetical protein n=1 Tax=Pseudomonas sp. NBRC 111128 TaxID=1661043 RepID=UPI0006D3D256|nr:hypothetical protein [Pseudomonas sp. NBRC 111128]